MSSSVKGCDPARLLLQQIAAGSESALEEFYRLFESRVYAFALNRLNDPHDAADILNEAMLAVWRSAGHYEGRSKVLTWLLGIVHHKVCDRLRQRAKHSLVETVEVDPDIPDEDANDALQVLDNADHAKVIQQCMDKLSDAHRLVVHLAFFEELHYAEIAQIVDCPEGTVKTRMFHAKQSLKHCLAQSIG